jgi:hypothetical protein
MRASLLALIALSGFSLFPSSAFAANVFNGVCQLAGTAHINPPAALLQKPGTFSFVTDGSVRNKCTGKLNGATVTNVYAWASASGTGKLSCTASNGKGTGTLWINGLPISFKLTIVGTGPQVTIDAMGNVSGAATGQASFATDGDAAGDCKDKNASDLTFIIAATAALFKG